MNTSSSKQRDMLAEENSDLKRALKAIKNTLEKT